MSWRNSKPTTTQSLEWDPKDDEYRKYMGMSITSIVADMLVENPDLLPGVTVQAAGQKPIQEVQPAASKAVANPAK